MNVYHFIGTNNIECNIKPVSEICIAIDKKHRLKIRSCYATWRTSPIEDTKVYNDMFGDIVHIYTCNSVYSIGCASAKEALKLAGMLSKHISVKETPSL